MKQRIIDTIRAVPIAGKSYKTFVEEVAQKLIDEGVTLSPCKVGNEQSGKLIEDMARTMSEGMCTDCEAYETCAECWIMTECIFYELASKLYNAGYPNSYKAAETVEVAREVIAAADEIINLICAMTGIEITAVGGKYLELRKKYTESEKDDG